MIVTAKGVDLLHFFLCTYNSLHSTILDYIGLSCDALLSCLCMTAKSVDQLLQLPFTEDEEHHLVSYLRTSSELSAQELLVMYYLQRSRFVEAIRLNNKIRHTPRVSCSKNVAFKNTGQVLIVTSPCF